MKSRKYACVTLASGTMSYAWNAPGYTCSSVGTPARIRRVAYVTSC